MAVGAPGKKRRFHFLIDQCRLIETVVPRMTLQTEKGLGHLEQRPIGRAMGMMALAAIFGDIGMLVNKRPLLLHVATGAEILDAEPLEIMFACAAMGLVAIDAGHLQFRHRMVGELAEFGSNRGVTAVTDLRHLLPADFLMRALMQLMAIETTDIVVGMNAGVPVLQGGSGGSGMALQTEQGLGLGGQIHDRQQGVDVALALLVGVDKRQAARAMAGFAIDQGKTGVGSYLLSMDRTFEILGDLVVLVAAAEAVVIADIIGVETANHHFFILGYR